MVKLNSTIKIIYNEYQIFMVTYSSKLFAEFFNGLVIKNDVQNIYES